MKLTEVPFGCIRVGDRCISANGIPGTITSFDPSDDGRRRGRVWFQWQNGKTSFSAIFLDDVPWLDRIEYIGRSSDDHGIRVVVGEEIWRKAMDLVGG